MPATLVVNALISKAIKATGTEETAAKWIMELGEETAKQAGQTDVTDEEKVDYAINAL